MYYRAPGPATSDMEQKRLEVNAGGGRSLSPSVRRTAFESDEFKQMYRKHRAEIDGHKRGHASKAGVAYCAKDSNECIYKERLSGEVEARTFGSLLHASRPDRLESANNPTLKNQESVLGPLSFKMISLQYFANDIYR